MRHLNSKVLSALGVTTVAALVLSSPPSPARPIDTRGWTLIDFVGHLRQRGVRLHVVPGSEGGSCANAAYLTENPDATWAAMQLKPLAVEHIRVWHGTVRVWFAHPHLEEPVDEWGPSGCRIGRFTLFGDEAILRRIHEACCL